MRTSFTASPIPQAPQLDTVCSLFLRSQHNHILYLPNRFALIAIDFFLPYDLCSPSEFIDAPHSPASLSYVEQLTMIFCRSNFCASDATDWKAKKNANTSTKYRICYDSFSMRRCMTQLLVEQQTAAIILEQCRCEHIWQQWIRQQCTETETENCASRLYATFENVIRCSLSYLNWTKLANKCKTNELWT